MNLSDFDQSKYLAGRDIPPAGQVATIAGFTIVDMKDGTKKPAITWLGGLKPMLLNKTNRQRLAKIFGSDDTQAMIGQRIVVYWDPDVSFGGETVGGLRLRAFQVDPTAAARDETKRALPAAGAINPLTGKPYQIPSQEPSDDIPF